MERWIVIGLALAIAIALGLWLERRRKEAREEGQIPFLGASFAQLKQNPYRLDRMRDQVSKVCVITEEIDHGRQGGTATSYESFLVTVRGEIVNLQQAEDDVMIEENARWLAAQLGVPFELS